MPCLLWRTDGEGSVAAVSIQHCRCPHDCAAPHTRCVTRRDRSGAHSQSPACVAAIYRARWCPTSNPTTVSLWHLSRDQITHTHGGRVVPWASWRHAASVGSRSHRRRTHRSLKGLASVREALQRRKPRPSRAPPAVRRRRPPPRPLPGLAQLVAGARAAKRPLLPTRQSRRSQRRPQRHSQEPRQARRGRWIALGAALRAETPARVGLRAVTRCGGAACTRACAPLATRAPRPQRVRGRAARQTPLPRILTLPRMRLPLQQDTGDVFGRNFAGASRWAVRNACSAHACRGPPHASTRCAARRPEVPLQRRTP